MLRHCSACFLRQISLSQLIWRLVFVMTLSACMSLQAQEIPSNADELCHIQLLNPPKIATALNLIKDTPSYLFLPSGENRLRLSCNLDEQAVLTFGRDEIMKIDWQGHPNSVTPLSASSPSYLLPSGQFAVDFILLTHHEYQQQFAWRSITEFISHSLLNNITMGVFYGLCLTLILYVYFMGRVVGDSRFELYSLYVFCAATFFLLQEGQLNIVLPEQSFLLSHQFYLLFAGLTVLSATIFIVRLTDLYLAWPKLSRYGLEAAATIVLLLSVVMLLLDHSHLSVLLGMAMARITLLLMLGIFVLVAIQAYRRQQSARITLVSLGLMVVAMIFRTILSDVSPFLHRYALIFAFSVEAFMLAVAVSARIKNIKQDKLRAESLADTDALCNVLNRRGWNKKANKIINEQRRKGGFTCLLYIDLDQFKQINDQWGHDVGDKVLKVVADIIRNQVRTNDCIGRLGGDEFVVLGRFRHAGEAENLASRVSSRLRHCQLQIEQHTTLEISASVGFAVYDRPPIGVDDMLDQADKSMYQVKRSSQQTATQSA